MSACVYCGQELHLEFGMEFGGTIECGGKGEGMCSFWCAIYDYDRDGRPADLDVWIDGWIQEQFGATWHDSTLGWDRGKHREAVRSYYAEHPA